MQENQDTAAEIADYLLNSVSVSLTGLRGSGRSSLARQVANQLDEEGLAVLSVRGIAALRERPLAALALAGVAMPPAPAAPAIAEAVAELSELLPAHHSVLVIDDVDELDAESYGVIVAAHLNRHFPVLSVTRPMARRRPVNRALGGEFQPGVQVMLHPLHFGQVNRLVHRLLGGVVNTSTVAQIAILSGGLPGLASAIVDTARRTGAIAEESSIWQAKGELWNPRLAHAVNPLLADLTDEGLEALTQLALAGTVQATEARRVIPERMFAQLDAMGLLQIVETALGPMVGVFPPLLVDYLRSISATASRLASLPHTEESAREAANTPVAGHGSSKLAFPASRLVLTSPQAAILYMRVAEHWQARLQHLRAEWEQEPDTERAVPLLAALNALAAQRRDFATVIDGTHRRDTSPAWDVRFAEWEAAYHALLLDDLDTATRLLDERRERFPDYATQLRGIHGALALLAGPAPDPEALAGVPGEPDPYQVAVLESVRISTLLATGRTSDALAELATQRVPLTENPYYFKQHRVNAGLARVLHGDFEGGITWALHAMSQAEIERNLGEIHAHAYVAALGLAFSGRLDDLDALLGPILTLTGTTIMSEHYRIGVLALASLAASWRGQMDYSWSLSAQAETTGHRPGPFPGMLHGVTPLIAAADGRWDEAGERLWRAAEERFAKGYIPAGIAVSITAMEICPDAARAELVARHAHATQSPFLTAIGDYIAASAGTDPDALEQCAGQLWALGARTHAVKALVTSALRLRAQGEIKAANQRTQKAWAWACELSETRSCAGLFIRLGYAIGLSSREREIAGMITDGVSVASIADSLELSVRTVENYLFGAYHKLGVESRDELIGAFSTWASFI